MYSRYRDSNKVTAEKVEERWTCTTVHAVFKLPSLSRAKPNGTISVDFPLLNEWTFALSLSPEYPEIPVKKGRPKQYPEPIETHEWNPVALAFHRRGRVIPWGDTSMHAELSLTADPPANSGNSTFRVTMEKVALEHSHSLEIELALDTLSLKSSSKISLNLTISKCPFSTGLLHITSGHSDEADAQKWLAKQCGERLLSRSLTNGTIHDMKFLASSGRNSESLLETYAWLSILKGRINPSLAQLSVVWTSILNGHENPEVGPVVEIPCPEGCEYELDSDYDEDEAVEPIPSLLPGERDDSATLLEVRESDSKTEEPFSSSERDEASDTNSSDSLPEESVQDQEVLSDSSSKTTTDCKRTVVIKFAAHRTWYAFLWYLYTGHIEFCELKSQVEHGVRRLRVIGDGPPSCSPKSMYRFADLVGDNNLKALSLTAIKARMTKTNVLEEMFSVFTSKYLDVRKAQLNVLIKHRASPEVKKAFLEKISESGIMPHAKPALEAFYDKLAALSGGYYYNDSD